MAIPLFRQLEQMRHAIAGAANPAPGQCVWADRGPRGSEIMPGGGNVICDFSGAMQSVPAGTFVEVGVAAIRWSTTACT
jgi:hypothetical protein